MSESNPDDKGPRRAGNIGFGRPPAQHQFKPGQSGNPKGRPRKPTDDGLLDRSALAAIVCKEAAQRITIREGDKSRRISSIQAVVRSMKVQAIKGDYKSQLGFTKMVQLAENEVAARRIKQDQVDKDPVIVFAIPDNGRGANPGARQTDEAPPESEPENEPGDGSEG